MVVKLLLHLWCFYYTILKMVELTEDNKRIMDLVEPIVCKYFNVNEKDVVSRNHKRDASLARGFIWYILHYNYGFSIKKLANGYYRNIRSITSLIAKTKHAIKKQVSYKQMYDTIIEKME